MLARGLQARPSTTRTSPTFSSLSPRDVGRRRAPMAPLTTRATAGGNGGKKTGVLFVCLGNICRSPTAEAVFRSVVERKGLADKFDIDSCGTGGGSANVSASCCGCFRSARKRGRRWRASGFSFHLSHTQACLPPLHHTPNQTLQWYRPGGFSYHEGDAADPRMTAAASKRGVALTSRSRPLTPEDWASGRFSHVVCMDGNNVRAVEAAVQYWKGSGQLDKAAAAAAPAPPPPRLSLMTDWAPAGSKAKKLGSVPDPYYGGGDGFDMVLDLLDEAAEGLLEQALGEQQQQQKAAA